MKKVCVVTASALTLRAFMRNHLRALGSRYEVTIVADFSAEELALDWPSGVKPFAVAIPRKIAPAADLRALYRLVRLFRARRFHVVHSVTPKAGLLAMSAARLAGVPHRMHCFTGQVWATREGLARSLLKAADRSIVAMANQILTDSDSQRHFLEQEGVIGKDVALVLGKGSISGVDLDRFRPDATAARAVREELSVPQQACLVLFVGRLNRDKGVLDLARAFSRLTQHNDNAWLLLVGPDEEGIGAEFEQIIGDVARRVRRIDFTATPERYMAAADVFVLPSYREGFGSVVIEAAACAVPTVASRIYGLTDAVIDGETGLLHPAGDVEALLARLQDICGDPDLRGRLGQAARERAVRDFSKERLTEELLNLYQRLLSGGGAV